MEIYNTAAQNYSALWAETFEKNSSGWICIVEIESVIKCCINNLNKKKVSYVDLKKQTKKKHLIFLSFKPKYGFSSDW